MILLRYSLDGLTTLVPYSLTGLIQSYSMHSSTSNVAHKPTLFKAMLNMVRQARKKLRQNFMVVHPVKREHISFRLAMQRFQMPPLMA